jgi:hypothetical protein
LLHGHIMTINSHKCKKRPPGKMCRVPSRDAGKVVAGRVIAFPRR